MLLKDCPPIRLDEDTSYLLGLLYGKGFIEEKNDQCRFRFEIRYKLPSVEKKDVAYAIVKDFLKLQRIIETELSVKTQIGELPEPGIKFRRPITLTTDWVNARGLLLRRLFDVDVVTNTVLYRIPDYVFNHPSNIIKTFLQGIADSTSLPPSTDISKGTAAFTEAGADRVQLELEFARWYVAVQVCKMFQERMKAKVFMINWGHPNIRGKDTWKGQNHQLRLYFNEFAKVGFRMEFKRIFFEGMMEKLKPSSFSRQKDYCPRKCNPAKNAYKCSRHNENDEDIPLSIRGLHFNAFWQVCEKLGCTSRRTCRDAAALNSFKGKTRSKN